MSNLVGESWVYYFLFGLLEIALTLMIVARLGQVCTRALSQQDLTRRLPGN